MTDVLEPDVEVVLGTAPTQFVTLSHPLALWIMSRTNVYGSHSLKLTHGDVTRLRGWLMARREGSTFEPTPDTTPERPYGYMEEGVKLAWGELNVSRPQPNVPTWRLELKGDEVTYSMLVFRREHVPYARFTLESLRATVAAFVASKT